MGVHYYLGSAIMLLGIALGSSTLSAHEAPEFTRLPSAQPTDTPGKIEVIEFFWYGCPHCNKLEPAVEHWEKRLPKDVVLRREHVIWDGRSDIEGHARLYITLRAMGLLAQHHRAVFDAIHAGKAKLRGDAEIFDWVSKRGIDRSKFEATYKSFGVKAQMSRAKALTRDYGIDGVPTFAINGKYTTSLAGAHSEDRLFALIDKFIADERPKK